jgi:hypothetical protein
MDVKRNGCEEDWIKGFDGKTRIKEPLGRPRRRWMDNNI